MYISDHHLVYSMVPSGDVGSLPRDTPTDKQHLSQCLNCYIASYHHHHNCFNLRQTAVADYFRFTIAGSAMTWQSQLERNISEV